MDDKYATVILRLAYDAENDIYFEADESGTPYGEPLPRCDKTVLPDAATGEPTNYYSCNVLKSEFQDGNGDWLVHPVTPPPVLETEWPGGGA